MTDEVDEQWKLVAEILQQATENIQGLSDQLQTLTKIVGEQQDQIKFLCSKI